ncbi:hypothetical protein [Streptomyces sp. NBC_00059]|uniref:hypothetical protein n=1 Tax=Streptomyces sp. NBC_00059 TaxID=2975635 RepID=UPI00224CB1B0|nr:hypothetical protein [Streptomyces sp. NBC_00059]MCX5417780.1 hypothetical protein [Streptomyces sp. NBC_00059]
MVGGNILMMLVAMVVHGGALITSLYARQVLGCSAVKFSVAFAHTTGTDAMGLNNGFQDGFLATAVFTLAGLVTALLLLLKRDPAQQKAAGDAEPAEAPEACVPLGH